MSASAPRPGTLSVRIISVVGMRRIVQFLRVREWIIGSAQALSIDSIISACPRRQDDSLIKFNPLPVRCFIIFLCAICFSSVVHGQAVSPLIPDAYLEKEVTLSVSSLIHAISSRVKTDFASSMLKHSIGIRMGGSHGLSTACGRRIADPTVWTESKHRDAIESDHDPRHFLAGENRLQTVLYLRRSLEAAQLVA